MIAVIPARGGSKGVPNKNIKLLHGKPLIAYSIEAALNSNLFETVVVSTDNQEIASKAKEYGAEVPFLRPKELSGDAVSSDDVILHTLDFYESNGKTFDSVCKLQPTSPLRDFKHIREAYKIFKDNHLDFVVSVCECEHSPLWCGVLGENNSIDEFIRNDVKRVCRQSMERYYRLNGAIYIGKVIKYREYKNFLGKNGQAYIMEQRHSIDIDSYLDFYFAECVMQLEDDKR